MLKPGVLNRRLVGEVISRLEKKGLKLVGLKLMNISPELASKHYAEHKGKPFYDPLVDYITSGPVVAMVWQGDDCITLVRKMTGSTSPAEAHPGLRSDPGGGGGAGGLFPARRGQRPAAVEPA